MLTVLLGQTAKMMLAEIRIIQKMKFYILTVFLLLTLIVKAEEPVKKLSFKYNDNVVIWITNQICSTDKLKKEYPYAAVATRIDYAVMPGCYTHIGENIKIQWIGGDFSVFPANVFLINPKEQEQNIKGDL